MKPAQLKPEPIFDVLKINLSEIKYELKDEIGRGAQGKAYKAKWKVTDVVFKKLSIEKRMDPQERQEFLRELQVWR